MRDNLHGKAINKIHDKKELMLEHPLFEVIVKKDGETVFHNKGYAGVINIVQSIDKMNFFDMEGDSQVISFGHPMIILFAIDQLRQKTRQICAYAVNYLKAMKERMTPEEQNKHFKEVAEVSKYPIDTTPK